jgi:hypothetical protein
MRHQRKESISKQKQEVDLVILREDPFIGAVRNHQCSVVNKLWFVAEL